MNDMKSKLETYKVPPRNSSQSDRTSAPQERELEWESIHTHTGESQGEYEAKFSRLGNPLV